ncbi:hypothetical protein WMC41_06925 [Shinella yambaruensis]|uniref:M10 family metallopeptidase C-terminal domain-containing protein n=1 Tax=Shinella TaxID=323620 RepID=UPI002584FD84|nr:hypothetical protein [Shinella sp.]MCW5712183.1 hypothetical protein [Shinella sp.]
MLKKPPSDYARGFHTKAFEWKGIYILANDAIPDEAVYRAAEIIFNSIAGAGKYVSAIVDAGGRFAIIPEGTKITELPDYSDLGASWDIYRGLGAVPGRPTSSSGEENLLNYPTDPYGGSESIALHEWAHAIDNLGVSTVDKGLMESFSAAYENAKRTGLWKNTYADDTLDEYFAELSQAYFNDNPEREGADGIHNEINTRTELAKYDPKAYAILKKIYGEGKWSPGDFFGEAGADMLKGTSGDNLIFGNGGNDRIYAGAGADYVLGGTGNDTISGSAGKDKLMGEAGNDRISGGTGADSLHGGSGADVFVFASVRDSTASTSGRDTIADFSRAQKDKIDLKAMDANTKSAGDQAFTFIGTDSFHKKAGELRYEKKNGDTIIHADVNGDGKADFSILLDTSLSLKATDFIL